MFALIDCNNFYASCERLFRPDLHEKPILILSNNDGCVIARSNEAKKLGIEMGARFHEIKNIIENNNVYVFSSNYTLYGDLSYRVMGTLNTFSPESEIYSIDEIFLQFKGFEEYFNLLDYAIKIRKKVTKDTGIPVSVGIANTKVLAKLANRISKKYPQKNGVHIINTDELREKALKWCKISDVWGIGKQISTRLLAENINTAYDFTLLDEEVVRKKYSVVVLRILQELKGKSVLSLEDVQDKKSITTSRSFEKNITSFDEISERLSSFTANCAEKLRKQKSHCNAIMVFINTNYHRKDLSQYSNSTVIDLPFSTNSTIELTKFAIDALKRIYKKDYAYKKCGIVVMNITNETQPQLSLFENTNPKHKDLMLTMDRLNKTIGSNKIKLLSTGLGKRFKMKQEKLSPRYTTRLNEILTIKV